MSVFVHPQAINESSHVGEGTKIWAFAHVQKEATVGKNCNVGNQCFIESGCHVGDGVTIKNNISLWEGITVENFCFLGPNVVFCNDLYPRSPRGDFATKRYQDKSWLEKTLIQTGASIGSNATILCGITIGQFAFIAAGSVVTKDVAAYTLVAGNPARVIGHVCECGHRLEFDQNLSTCQQCQKSYQKNADGVFLKE